MNLAWNVPRDGASTTSLGNLGQGLTTLTVKNFFPISSLNLPSFSLKLLPLVLLQISVPYGMEKIYSVFLNSTSGIGTSGVNLFLC